MVKQCDMCKGTGKIGLPPEDCYYCDGTGYIKEVPKVKKIKYRAWYKTLNIMCDVAAINFYYGNIVLLARNEEQRNLFQKMNKEALVECNDRLSVPMKDVELMQDTELNDKNSKRICEGDIVKALNRSYDNEDDREKHFQVFLVTYMNGCWMFGGTWNAHEFFNKFMYIEVIGNSHDKLDLSKEV